MRYIVMGYRTILFQRRDHIGIIITRANRAFSSEFNVGLPPFEFIVFVCLKEEKKLFDLDKPTIAAIHGYVLRDGLQLNEAHKRC